MSCLKHVAQKSKNATTTKQKRANKRSLSNPEPVVQ